MLNSFSQKLPVSIPFAIPDISGFTPQWENLRQLGRCHKYPAGTMLELKDEASFDLLCLESGIIRIVYDTYGGRTRTVISFEEGSIVNLASATTRRTTSGYFQCATDCIICHLPGKLLHDPKFIAKYPEFVICAMQILGTVVLTHHTSLTDMLLDDFIVRFCRFLLSLSVKHKSLDFAPNMTQETLATTFGIHKATLARAIQQLKKDEIIQSFTTHRTIILDIEKLRGVATR